jgi:hypothetical protein
LDISAKLIHLHRGASHDESQTVEMIIQTRRKCSSFFPVSETAEAVIMNGRESAINTTLDGNTYSG